MSELEANFGDPVDDLAKCEKHGVFIASTDNMHNVKHLKEMKIRPHTEPDAPWWQEN